MTSTDHMIRALAARATPVTPLPTPGRRTAYSLALSLALVTCAAVAAGLRADLAGRLDDAAFLLRALVLVAGAAASSYAALTVAVPGAQHGRHIARLALFASFGAIVMGASACPTLCSIVSSTALGPAAGAGSGAKCVRDILVGAGLAAVPLGAMLRRSRVVVMPREQHVAAACACALVADVASRFMCRNDGAIHLVVWHALPVIVVVAVVAAAARLVRS
jgi:hypothetical protein